MQKRCASHTDSLANLRVFQWMVEKNLQQIAPRAKATTLAESERQLDGPVG